MIFVITGTEKFPFDRLVMEIDKLSNSQSFDDEIFIQIGSCTYKPQSCKSERFLSFGDMCEKIQSAQTVIAHAGAGVTLLCIQLGHKPIIIPRQKKYCEHVDDHQLSFARKIEPTGLVTLVIEPSELRAKITTTRSEKVLSGKSESRSRLLDHLESLMIQR